MLKDKLFTLLEEKEEQMIQDRRWLHEHPELSFAEISYFMLGIIAHTVPILSQTWKNELE